MRQFSVLSSQFSVLSSQFSVLSSQFSVLSSQFSVKRNPPSVFGLPGLQAECEKLDKCNPTAQELRSRLQKCRVRKTEEELGAGHGELLSKIKSSEVVLGPFLSASSSLLDPCSTCFRFFPCGLLRAIFARAPGLPPTGQTYPTPRNSILPSTGLLVLLDQRLAIDPRLPSLLTFQRGE